MKIRKQPLLQDRIRRPPKEGWSWIDRRFLRDHVPALERDSILLYFFLSAVSDKYGLSYYGDTSIAAQLRISEDAVVRAREQLELKDLVAFRHPIYQVLALPSATVRRPESEPGLVASILRELVPQGPGCPLPAKGRAP